MLYSLKTTDGEGYIYELIEHQSSGETYGVQTHMVLNCRHTETLGLPCHPNMRKFL
ncbi:Rpn family recombination-promoting nuclease/putative transposase [Enterobacter bugandensis]|uniref:Rpn family recombination-promoting nuclease/putative transposase n=1 Tax=Enterobacter bugandensis TaxID=881260 RepID=UPI0035AB7110